VKRRSPAPLPKGRFGEFYGLDQDRDSLALIEQEQSAQGVKAVHGSVKSI
jgi:hypothetical protein